MDAPFWHERWQKKEIGFHRDEPHPSLQKFWPGLALEQGAPVLVPLCGMSPDMTWLAQAGHNVIGVELSEIAIASFFEMQNLTPNIRETDNFKVWSNGPFELWAGDIFKLPPGVINACTAVFDRASLVALPDSMQKDYAELLNIGLLGGAKILLIALDYDSAEMDGPPFSTPIERIKDLFEPAFHIDKLADNADALQANANLAKRGLSSLTESCYCLKKRTT